MATWPTIIDDDGSGTTGTVLNDALFDQIKAYVDEGAPAGSVAVNNGGSNIFDVVLPTPRPFYYVRVYPTTADITIRGITAGRMGDVVLVEHIGLAGYLVLLDHQAAAAAATTRLTNRVSSGKTPLAYRGSALYVWEPADNGWTLAQHDQAKAIRVPYNAANYVPAGGGSWTVQAGDIANHDYFLRGDLLTVTVNVITSTIAGTVNNVQIGGFPFTLHVTNGVHVPAMLHGPPWVMAYAVVTGIGLQFVRLDAAPFTVGTDMVYVSLNATFKVT